jgi:hypothetical protein
MPTHRTNAQPSRRAYNRAYAEANRERIAAQRKAAYEENRELQLAKAAAYRAANRERIQAAKRAFAKANPDIIANQRAGANLRRRADVLRHYGGEAPACACCGESVPGFLTIDHIGGGGNAHRREIGQSGLYSWLKVHGYPEGYRVLCFNCNWANGAYGACPHVDPSAGNWSDAPPRWVRAHRNGHRD